MVIIWRGCGFVVPIVVGGGLAVSRLIVDHTLGEGYLIKHGWPQTIAGMLIACILWSLGRWMNRPEDPPSVPLRPDQAYRPPVVHDFFFVPVEYRSFVMVAYGVLAAFI
jgi:hypothetical protein